MLALDLFRRHNLESPQFDLSVLGLLLLTTLLAIRFGLYRPRPADRRGLAAQHRGRHLQLSRGLRPELFFFVVMLFLSQHAAGTFQS